MTKAEREALQKRIKNYYNQHSGRSKAAVVNHFKEEGILPASVYYTLKKYEESNCVGDLMRSGRPPKITKKKVKRLQKLVNNKDGISQKSLALNFSVHQTTISRVLKNKTNIRYRKKEDAPDYTDAQLERVIRSTRKLAINTFKEKFVILDDEKYFTLSNTKTPGNKGYYTDNKSLAPANIRFNKKVKFPRKVMVWLAVSKKGVSKPYIQENGIAINADTYINKCLKPNWLPFISQYHKDDDYIFWPDLASSHYANKTVEWLTSKNINLVNKADNPPNVPKARPIEDLWAILSQKVYEKGWKAKTTSQLKRRIRSCIKKIDLNPIQAMFERIRTKLRKIADYGPYSIY